MSESQVHKECREDAMARHYMNAALTPDGVDNSWLLSAKAATLGLEPEKWFKVARDGPSAVIFIGDDIGCWGETAKILLDGLDGVTSIKLVIDSAGGDSDCALTLFHALKGRTVEATVTGKCFSAAVTICMAAQTIKVAESARFMVHQPVAAKMGTSADLRRSADILDTLTGETAQIIATRTRQPLATVQGWFDSPTDTYFSSAQAVEFGLADEITLNAPPTVPGFDIFTGAVGSLVDGPTDDEAMYWRVRRKMGNIAVKDPQKFLRSAFAELAHHVRQG